MALIQLRELGNFHVIFDRHGKTILIKNKSDKIMSVDKTIEELSYTLTQLGNLVGHINSQIGQLASRINLTLDTFDHSVAGIAIDAEIMSTHVANTISQVPNGWLLYLLLLTIIVVFLLLSVTLILGTIKRSFDVYELFKKLSTSDSGHSYGHGQYRLGSNDVVKQDHISISMDMEHEPRRVGREINGDIKKRRPQPDRTHRLQYRNYASSFNNDQYLTTTIVTTSDPSNIPTTTFTNSIAQV
uniref:Bm2857 n=1 Tax=Brugia malayi TaxID=6279 RepID=A0A0H5S9D6_BRUMA|nr:Bm2857 [Brugia malayi]